MRIGTVPVVDQSHIVRRVRRRVLSTLAVAEGVRLALEYLVGQVDALLAAG